MFHCIQTTAMADLVSEDTRDKTYDDIPGLQPWMLQQLRYLSKPEL